MPKIVKLSLSISQSLNLSLSLRDRDRADTIITLPPLFKDLRVDLYSSVIHHCNLLKPILFLHRKHRVNWGHFSPPLSAIGLRDIYLIVDLIVRQSVTLSQSFCQSDLVNQSDFINKSNIIQSNLNSQSKLLSHNLISLALSFSFFSF